MASAGDVPITVAWDSWGLRGNKCLSLYEVWIDDLEGKIDELGTRRDAVPRVPVGHTALDMHGARSLTIPTGETRCYVIRYGDDLVYDLPLAAGWNLVSLPIRAGQSCSRVGAGRRRARTRPHGSGHAHWQGGAYAETDRMCACHRLLGPCAESSGPPGQGSSLRAKRIWTCSMGGTCSVSTGRAACRRMHVSRELPGPGFRRLSATAERRNSGRDRDTGSEPPGAPGFLSARSRSSARGAVCPHDHAREACCLTQEEGRKGM